MTDEDEEFNRIEREAAMRKEAVAATIARREWVGLTDEEVEKLWQKVWHKDSRMIYDFAQAVEAKLKEKNDL